MLSGQVLIGGPRPSLSGIAEHRNIVKFWFADLGLSMRNCIHLGANLVTLTS